MECAVLTILVGRRHDVVDTVHNKIDGLLREARKHGHVNRLLWTSRSIRCCRLNACVWADGLGEVEPEVPDAAVGGDERGSPASESS